MQRTKVIKQVENNLVKWAELIGILWPSSKSYDHGMAIFYGIDSAYNVTSYTEVYIEFANLVLAE